MVQLSHLSRVMECSLYRYRWWYHLVRDLRSMAELHPKVLCQHEVYTVIQRAQYTLRATSPEFTCSQLFLCLVFIPTTAVERGASWRNL
jgi:hypothetical protein